MASSLFSCLILVACFVADAMFQPDNVTSGSTRGNFPLQNCRADDVDLLSLLEYDRDQTWRPQHYLIKHLLGELGKVVFNENLWRKAAVLDQFSDNNVPIDVSTWRFHVNQTGEPYSRWDLQSVGISVKNIKTILERKINFIDRLFQEMRGVRNKSSKVGVIFINGANLKQEEISRVPSIVWRRKTNVNIFVVIFGSKLVKEIAHLTDTLVLPDMNLAKFHHYLLMAMCNRCSKGWHQFKQIKYSTNILTCYNVVTIVKSGWEAGMSYCSKQYNSFLAGIETLEEMNNFQQVIQRLRKRKNLTEKSDNYSIKLNIGLQRNLNNYAKRFQWVTTPGKYQPLLINKWLPGKPSTGCMHRDCAIWKSTSKWTNDRNDRKLLQNISIATDWFVEGWEDVECHSQETNVSLCEVSLPQKVQDIDLFNITSAQNKSFSDALTKGNFMNFQGNIISVSVNVENQDFLKFLRGKGENFPTFDCGEDTGDSRYISYSLVCDFIEHCSNKRDELSCSNPRVLFESKRGRKFRNYCLSGQKLLKPEYNCDNINDCNDGSDERSCFDHPCYSVRCYDGSCLPRNWINDGEVDCLLYVNDTHHFNVDDENSLANTYLPNDKLCALICNSSLCIELSSLNNTIINCTGLDTSLNDTIGKLKPANTCRNTMGNVIWAPMCHYIRDAYGGIIGCRDMSHLGHCENFECVQGYVKCYKSFCIPRKYLRDGKADCPTGEDEQPFYSGLCKGQFACWDSTNCLHPELVCDSYSDCPHHDDEIDCDVRCPEMFRCIAGTATLVNYNRSNALNLSSMSALDRRTRYLDLSGAKLSGFDTFMSVNVEIFLNLKVLILSNCNINKLPEHSFDFGYTKIPPFMIQRLDISYNNFKAFTKVEVIYYYKNLHFLNMSHNTQLKIIKNLRFSFLEMIDLSYTNVSYLNDSVFAWLPKLKHLNLSNTLISDFSRQFFPSQFTLETLDLRDIRATDFHDYLSPGLTIRGTVYTDHFQICCPQVKRKIMKSQECVAPEDEDAISSCSKLIKLNVQRVLLWIVAIIAVLGNMTVIVYRVIWDKSVLQTGYGLFVTNLGISDFVMGVYLFIIAGADYSYRDNYVFYDKNWRNSVVCKIAGFMACLSCEASTFFVFLITLDRFLVIKYPFGKFKFSSLMKCIVVTTSWVVSFLLSLVPIVFSFGIYSSNAMCLGLPLTNTRVRGWEYSVGLFIVHNFFMFLFTAYGQYAIFRAMKDKRITTTSCLRRAEDITVAKQLSLVVLSNFLFWFPAGLMGLMSLGGYEVSNEVYAWTTVLLLPINSAVNPVLYTIPAVMARWETFKHMNQRTLSPCI